MLQEMRRIETACLCTISGGYRGSNNRALGWICNVEPLQVCLKGISTSWVAREVRNGDPMIRNFLNAPTGPGTTSWHDGTNVNLKADSAITRAFHGSGIPEEGISWGDREMTTTHHLHDLTIYEPTQEMSKSKGIWAAELDKLKEEGPRIGYGDGTGRKGLAASGVYSEDAKGNPSSEYGTYLGDLATVADAERTAIMLVLENEGSSTLAVAFDSQAAIASVPVKGGPRDPESRYALKILSLRWIGMSVSFGPGPK